MRGRARRIAGLVAGALALVLAPDCVQHERAGGSGGEGGSGGAAVAGESAVLWAATWKLTWDLDRTTPIEGGGFSVDNDLGYHVSVSSAWTVDHSVSFGACDPAQPDAGAALGLRFGIRSAFAHSDADPSAIEAMHPEDLANPTNAGPWPSVFPATRYCRAHWLVARPTAPLDAATDVDLEGRSVRVTGTWDLGGEPQPFEVDTWWPYGHSVELADATDPDALAEADADGEARVANVTVMRRLGAIFDGIDFAEASHDQIAGRLLDNLLTSSELHVELVKSDGG